VVLEERDIDRSESGVVGGELAWEKMASAGGRRMGDARANRGKSGGEEQRGE